LTSPKARVGTVAGGVTIAQIAELQGFGAVFSLDGSKLAYLKLSPSPALKAAFAELDRARKISSLRAPPPERPHPAPASPLPVEGR